jgi:hypothetical protein
MPLESGGMSSSTGVAVIAGLASVKRAWKTRQPTRRTQADAVSASSGAAAQMIRDPGRMAVTYLCQQYPRAAVRRKVDGTPRVITAIRAGSCQLCAAAPGPLPALVRGDRPDQPVIKSRQIVY